jgi:hypothetical protein
MRGRLILFVIAVLFSFQSFAQDQYFPRPDYSEIKKLTTDKSSAFFYDNLFERYTANDTTLTLRDYRMLYYGYLFHKSYNPFLSTPEEDAIRDLLNKEVLSSKEWERIITLGKENLVKNPFDLKGLNIVWMAYRQKGDSTSARFYFDKLKKLVQTVLATGDGQTEETAYHILNVADEYNIIGILGYEFAGDQNLTDSHRSYLTVKDNPDHVKGIYFDVQQIFEAEKMAAVSRKEIE